MKNESSKKSPKTQTSGVGDALVRGEFGDDARNVVILAQWARANGLAPTAVQSGTTRIELMPVAPATNITPPTEKDRKTLYAEFGGPAMQQLLQDDDEDDDEDVPAVTS